MADDKLAALEHLGLAQNEALRVLIDHVRALALVNTALIATLDPEGRAAVRQIALSGMGDGPEHDRTVALIEAFTSDPAAALADRDAVAGGAPTDGPGQLQ